MPWYSRPKARFKRECFFCLQVVKFCIDGLRCLMPLLELTILLAVGLDLAKEDAAIAAFGPDHEGPYLIDRIPYDKLYELLADMAPTLVAMEPCSGAHQIAEQI